MTDVVTHDTVDKPTMSVKEAAGHMGVSKSTVYEIAHTSGQIAPGIPILKIRGTYRIPRARLLAFVAGDWNPTAEETA